MHTFVVGIREHIEVLYPTLIDFLKDDPPSNLTYEKISVRDQDAMWEWVASCNRRLHYLWLPNQDAAQRAESAKIIAECEDKMRALEVETQP